MFTCLDGLLVCLKYRLAAYCQVVVHYYVLGVEVEYVEPFRFDPGRKILPARFPEVASHSAMDGV
jgi:hypothetical protein